MSTDTLKRELSLTQAVAVNMIDMVGIGPFVVLPIVIGIMGGPQHISAWIAGAFLAIIDGFIWAEYGAALPRAGGSYVFLRQAYGPRWGRLLSFLFIWQTMIQAPLVIASGSIGKISVALWIGVLATMAWFIIGGLSHFDAALAFDYPEGAWDFTWIFWVALGQATVQTMYSYLGYYNVNHLGSEIRDPEKNIPKAIFISIAGIAALYLAMQFAVIGVIPWQEAKESLFIVSTLIERLYGTAAATVATVLVLWIAFASLFAVMLGYSRIPYAAAIDGNFFSVMGRTHPTKNFPHIALLWLGGAALIFSMLFKMADVIRAILAMRIIVQFIGGAVGIMLLRNALGEKNIPYKMWLYPVPAVIAIVLWISIMLSTGLWFALSGVGMMLLGIVVFIVRAKILRQWPFTHSAE